MLFRSVNAAGPLLAGWLMYRLRDTLTGPRTAMVALLPPLAYAGVYGATTWPTTTALNSDSSGPIRWAAACVTMALCVVVVLGLRALTRSAEHPAGIPARELEPTT